MKLNYLVTSDSGEKTCYLLDVSKDMCVKPQKYDDRADPVAEVIDGTSDKSRCARPDLSLAYSRPARTICLEKR